MVFAPGFSQVVYEDISNTGIYDFLDELANLKFITLNSAIKPYSRSYIAGKLHDAKSADAQMSADPEKPNHRLNNRQRKELHFYLQDYQLESPSRVTRYVSRTADGYDHKLAFLLKNQQNMTVALNPLGIHYKDSLFTFSVRPILGVQWMTNENGSEYHRWWGGSMFGYIGKNFGFYASLRDNNASVAIAKPEYFTQEQGALYKPGSKEGVDFSEMRGGVVASWNWGSFGLIKERVEWGNNYHGATILSGKTPSFPSIQLHLNPAKWFDFNYIHAWLNSEVVDSNNSYYSGGFYREVYRNKFLAANMFTFIPWKGLNLSFGNSIVYSDNGVQPVFLIPFMFFNSVDATNSSINNNAGQNSQLFFDVSSRQIRHLHVWVSLFIDELKISRVLDPETLNWTSWKAGFRLNDMPLQNVALTAEWTKTNPITYKHYISTTTFSSNNYCMGHYLRDNSMEIYLALSWKPLRGIFLNLAYTLAQHGDEYPDDRSYSYDLLRFMKNKIWQNESLEFTARYEFINNGYFYIRYIKSIQEGDMSYQPEIMVGNTNNFNVGINIGL